MANTNSSDPQSNLRPLIITIGTTRVAVPVPSACSNWTAAEILRDQFYLSKYAQSLPAALEETSESTNEAEMDLLARFLGFVAEHHLSSPERVAVLHASFATFSSTYLSKQDIHGVCASLDTDKRATVLSSYFKSLAALEQCDVSDIPRGPSSALFDAAARKDSSIYAIFGGQGTNEVYFDELRGLYNIYTPYLAGFFSELSEHVLKPLAEEATNSEHSYYAFGLDVISWLNGTSTAPPLDYLASIPISFPLIGLTQLAQYLVSCKVLNLTPGQLREQLSGATGHSQGIVSAVVIASSTTFEEFNSESQKALQWLFFCGLRGQEAFPILAVDPAIVKDAVEGGEGTPSPMLSVTGMQLKDLRRHLDKTNLHLAKNSKLHVSLNNGPKAFVVTGPPKALFGLVTNLRKVRAPAGLDQSKTPFSQRKAVFSVRFLVVGVPYHNSLYLAQTASKVCDDDLKGQKLFSKEKLSIPVYNTEDGSDFRHSATDLTRLLCDQIFTSPIHWSKATNLPDQATHAIDFGPGGISGIGPLTARNLEGRGVRVLVVGEKGSGGAEIYSSSPVKFEESWVKKYAPKLVKSSDGTLHLDTAFSRLLGKPPLMVAGMTPSTVQAGFVSAVLRAGFHVELAGGGHYNAAALRSKVAEIQSQIPAGVGLTLNSLYINPKQFGFQLPLWQEMRRDGSPVEGFCVAAGIPSTEKATEILDGLRTAGIKHVSFKPGSVDGIRQVVNIASANPDFPVILQWTGGRAGGHHSCEDFHQPILATYAAIRQHSNIVLVAGSGFGGADDIWPYLTGEWSSKLFEVQPMPFDGFLFASRVMVAKEAHTSSSVKDLIVAATGVSDSQWEGTYAKETGGILTVRSELGEPIHKIATRGVKLWKEFDDTVFNLPRDKRAAWLADHKNSVIAKLNKDFAKPWFGEKSDGTVVGDLADMTYEEVTRRMVRLMFIAHQDRWVDKSLRTLTGDWLRRVEERFAGVNGHGDKTSLLQSFSSLDDPLSFLDTFFNHYTGAQSQLLASEDKAYFLAISQRPGQKPVPFIPVLDSSFEVWFKKDSLWQAEDIDGVFDQDPQRVCILQGPVAVKHSIIKDEPIKDLLGNVVSKLSEQVLHKYYNGEETAVEEIAFLGGSAPPPVNLSMVKSRRDGHTIVMHIQKELPPVEDWLALLAGSSRGWLSALLTSRTIVQGQAYIDNPVRRLFSPRQNQEITVSLRDDKADSISVRSSPRSHGSHDAMFSSLLATFDLHTSMIRVTVNEECRGSTIPLEFHFKYRPDQGFMPIHEITEGRTERIKRFYWKLWFNGDVLPLLDVRERLTGPKVTIEASHVERFCSIVGNQAEAFKARRQDTVYAPMDFAIVTGWQAIIKALFPKDVDGDILKLVHLSNSFRMMPGESMLAVGDTCQAEARISSIVNSDSGKTVKVKGYVMRSGKPIIEVVSAFLFRGRFTDTSRTFEIIDEDDYIVELEDESAVGVLKSKDWFEWINDASPLQAGTSLIFKLESEIQYQKDSRQFDLTVSGTVYVRNLVKELVRVATVQCEKAQVMSNHVLAFLKRHGRVLNQPALLENGGYTLTASNVPSLLATPLTNEPYSKASGDFNPIHVNPYFADYASLPATITHGLWTSAATRKYVENVVAQGDPSRVKAYNVEFVGMVLPGEQLQVTLKHIAMKSGNMIIEVTTTNGRGERILQGTAEVAQPVSCYVFTGQGSQEPGMGMELYSKSPAARSVWDGADSHLRSVYGFSILDIVKNNPKEKIIHFGGLKGQAIRQRYMEMSYDTMDKEGNVKTLPLFADIGDRTPRYTFKHPQGLLFATQFAQIALVVTEKAAFQDMHSKGLIQEGCAFAGHSLGEYSALASIADVLPISSLVDVVFYRGITMQRAVERDEHNRSNYAMCAVNPSRVSKSFTDAALREVVESIGQQTNLLLEIVNYNVEGQQYVCAGELVALQTMTNVLNYLKMQKIDIDNVRSETQSTLNCVLTATQLTQIMSVERVKEMLRDIITSSFQRATEQQKGEGHIKLERGFATIPLPGIDVPFHSRYLWAGVLPFRAYLSKKINHEHLDPNLLVGRYVPNLIAQPFEVSRQYAQKIYDQTSSPRLDKVLRHWDRDNWNSPSQRQKLAYVILVELLAYQFASPVRWIESQDRFFQDFKCERFIEIGPSPTLTGMATRTLKAKYENEDDSVARVRTVLCHSKNVKEVYYQFEDPVPEAAEEEIAEAVAASVSTTNVPVAPIATALSSAPAKSIEDEPLQATDTLRLIIAQKLKKKPEEIPITKSIKDLVGGKSTLQNEILGDLQVEFPSAPEKGEELPLDELGGALGVGYSGTLGKYTSGLVSRMVGSKMPGGFGVSSIKSHVLKSWGIGSSRADGVLLLALTNEPSKRLVSENDARAWIDSVVQLYAQRSGIQLSTGSQASGDAGSGGAVINSEEFLKFQSNQERFAEQQVQLYMRYLSRDSRSGDRAFDTEKANSLSLQARLDGITKEHGDVYIDGIQPIFEPLKARHFDSSWNWVRQDALNMFYDIIFGRLTTVDREITARCIAIMNRADAALLRYMQYHINQVDPERGETYQLAKQFGQQLIDNCCEVVGQPPLYKDVTFPTAPHTEVTKDGKVKYMEINREGVRKLEAYVEEMASGDTIPSHVNIQKVQDDVSKLWNAVKSQPEITSEQKNKIKSLYEGVVRSLRKTPDMKQRASRNRRPSSQFIRPQIPANTFVSADKVPLLHLKRRVASNWEYSSNLTSLYLDILSEIATSGTTFKDKNALLTGVGKGSIGIEILKGLLSGGAHVVITTSRYSRATVEYYQSIYHQFGSRGSALTVVPFNQGSKQDVEALIDYIYATLGLDLDYILPFAAVPENGREIDGLDDKSELAHRIMLVNILRLMGAVKTKKASRQFVTRPTQVILPLSPNHGLFGNDGLYSESKISLEILFSKWSSESWGEYLCVAGAVIGWTRGTGLMDGNNIVAHQVEQYGVRTFSAKEMAFNILGLMHPLLFSITQVEPIWADLNGGMDRLPDLAEIATRIRGDIMTDSSLKAAITRDNALDFKSTSGSDAERVHQQVKVTPRANFKFEFPPLGSHESFDDISNLRGLHDLDKVMVITGSAEVGPWGSSRTRWEMEARGEFSIEGCIEMAWMMGYIKHFDGRLKDGALYVGWVDVRSGEPVDDKDVKGKYEQDILSHAGVRLIEPELFSGYDPNKKVFNQEIQLTHDLEPLEVDEAEAQKFKREHGEKCDVWPKEGGQWWVKFKQGARVLVPKAFKFNRTVAGQLPTGWSAGRYGIPEDIVVQTDRVSLWALVCTAEALIMSGITDPYELYQHMHPSEVGTSLGSGMGGLESMGQMFKDRREGKEVQNDILQETFINTTAGWINLLLLSSSGPIKIPVGACATALQSLEIACDTILAGKAKVMIAGGFDDLTEEGSFEFGSMKATSNADTEFAMGREPNEFSRPTTTTRAGFMESQGTGVHVVMSARTAIQLGCPIRGIIGFTSTSTDKAGRSIPAPGRGALTIARQLPQSTPMRLLNIDYRARQLSFRRKQISEWMESERTLLQEEIKLDKQLEETYIASRLEAIEQEAARQEKDAIAMYGMLEGSDPNVAPLRRALAVWGLTADDIGVLSIHGTSTVANERNETRIWNDILSTIGRSPGNAVPVMAQKSLTGHSKGGSAAWQLIALWQSVNSGIIPGNRNADNVDAEFRQWEHLMFPSKSIRTDGIRCGVMTSFGFGQVGGSAMVIHPRYLFASLETGLYDSYRSRNALRALGSYKAMSQMMISNSLVKIQEHPPYTAEQEIPVLLNPLARISPDGKGGFEYPAKLPSTTVPSKQNFDTFLATLNRSDSAIGVGVDQELISAVPSNNHTFLERNFTETEISYCRRQPNPSASFAARWAGKEAVFKSLGVASRGAGSPMKDIEIITDSNGAPTVHLHGDAQSAAASKSVATIHLSLSHSETVAIAFAQAVANS